MFYYLSFLRPPPLQAAPFGTIPVTPQVANDLRTELYGDSQEIFYAWSYPPRANGASNAFPEITKPQKLTIWRQGSAYKEIPVPLPSGIREGQLCRLVLTAHPQGFPHVINLESLKLGERPLPVMSMPILFSARSLHPKGKTGAPTAGKQEQVERIYRIPTGPQQQVFISVKEQTSFDLDKKVWDSGIGLSSWIVGLAHGDSDGDIPPLLIELRDALLSPQPRRIVELGAGTGIVSIALGALRSATHPSDEGCIITTDLASAMPLLEHNIATNNAVYPSSSSHPNAVVLDWDEEQLPDEVLGVAGGFHAIIMADVTYNTSSFPPLIRTLSKLIKLGSTSEWRRPLILLGYKERDPAERSLWEMSKDIGVNFVQVGERHGAGGEVVEVWIGTMQ
ncbi:uncharacterized protein FIBRA_06347 [Fibroporia radiculosa]|uniref:Methyltransferase-domain-containing protein n=1 Tax=Fibroporia radiculosa TaxID=599839 RepID=J4GSK8_9APHY|nr:uncharacterized protein FIBRA_06347 [Fibroporia radiculosa]CCM04185.1 predicted protein [Fibroporia radiculosa]